MHDNGKIAMISTFGVSLSTGGIPQQWQAIEPGGAHAERAA
jgi:hypothetical protein